MHAEFSPSKAHRFLKCPGSHELEKKEPDAYSPVADEGTAAHFFVEQCLTSGNDPTYYAGKYIKKTRVSDSELKCEISDEGDPVSAELIGAAQIYCSYIRNLTDVFEVEKKINIFGNLCHGTADCVFIRKTTLYIVDFKYGAGIGVSAKNNEQMQLYAIGAMRLAPKEIRRAKLVIIQPRFQGGRIEEWVVSAEDLAAFEAKAAHTLHKIKQGSDEFNIGDHCKFCKAKAVCPAKSKNYIQAYSLRDTLSAKEILDLVEEIKDWINAIEEKALRDLQNGKEIAGWLAVPRQARAAYIPEALDILQKAGYPEDQITRKELISHGDMKKLVSEEDYAKIVKKESSGMKLKKEKD